MEYTSGSLKTGEEHTALLNPDQSGENGGTGTVPKSPAVPQPGAVTEPKAIPAHVLPSWQTEERRVTGKTVKESTGRENTAQEAVSETAKEAEKAADGNMKSAIPEEQIPVPVVPQGFKFVIVQHEISIHTQELI